MSTFDRVRTTFSLTLIEIMHLFCTVIELHVFVKNRPPEHTSPEFGTSVGGVPVQHLPRILASEN